MKFIKKYIIPILSGLLLIVGCVKINIINTEALSPLGNTDDNYNLVSKEFGEEFQEFIKDKSNVKIYVGEEDDDLATMKIYDTEINFTKDNFFMRSIEKASNYVSEVFNFIIDKFKEHKLNKNEENNNVNIESKYIDNNTVNTESNSNLDKFIDDFIEKKE